MKKLFLFVIFTSLIMACFTLTGCFSSKNSSKTGLGPNGSNGVAESVANQLLVRVKPGADLTAVLQEIGGQVISFHSQLNYYRIKYSANIDVETAKDLLSKNNQVLLAEPNYIMRAYVDPLDPDFSKQWSYERTNAKTAWDISTGSSSIIIAILDTGIDSYHDDLTNKVSGYNARSNSSSTSDDNGHGTHVAGIAAATTNALGITGVAPGCKLMPVKVLDYEGSGNTADIAEGIDWAVTNNANVINLSLGGPGYSRILNDAIDRAIQNKVTVIAAAGNDSRFNDNQFPAGIPGVIAVGATRPDDTKAAFSTETSHLFIAAPGENIYSTLRSDSYGYMSGTSMATPFVAGTVALIKSKYGSDLTVNQVRSHLKATAKDIESPGWDQKTGWGLVNLDAALRDALKPNEFGSLTVTVDDGQGNGRSNIKILLKNGNGTPIYNVITDSNGKANFWSLLPGTYTADVIGTPITASVSAGSDTNTTASFAITTILADNADTAQSQMVPAGTWAKTSSSYYSAPSCWTDSPAGLYGDRAAMSLTSTSFSLMGYSSAMLTFWHKYDTESFDHCYVEISTNGVNWTKLAEFNGLMTTWKKESLDLSQYINSSSVKIRFRFTSDGSVVYDGWYIDDIVVTN